MQVLPILTEFSENTTMLIRYAENSDCRCRVHVLLLEQTEYHRLANPQKEEANLAQVLELGSPRAERGHLVKVKVAESERVISACKGESRRGNSLYRDFIPR